MKAKPKAKRALHPSMVGHQFQKGHGNAHKIKAQPKAARSMQPGMVAKAFGRGK